jgi:DnaJ-domain-containing protein 1
MFGMNPREFIILAVVILVLYRLNLWPALMRSLRELRGEQVPPEEPSRQPSRNDTEVAFRLLGISPSSQWDEVERAYRQKAKIHHPDRGGDQDAMRALNDAYALIKRMHGRV